MLSVTDKQKEHLPHSFDDKSVGDTPYHINYCLYAA